jgi:hypothetical protein
MLFRETITAYSENHTEHTNTLCAKFIVSTVKSGGKNGNHCALKG